MATGADSAAAAVADRRTHQDAAAAAAAAGGTDTNAPLKPADPVPLSATGKRKRTVYADRPSDEAVRALGAAQTRSPSRTGKAEHDPTTGAAASPAAGDDDDDDDDLLTLYETLKRKRIPSTFRDYAQHLSTSDTPIRPRCTAGSLLEVALQLDANAGVALADFAPDVIRSIRLGTVASASEHRSRHVYAVADDNNGAGGDDTGAGGERDTDQHRHGDDDRAARHASQAQQRPGADYDSVATGSSVVPQPAWLDTEQELELSALLKARRRKLREEEREAKSARKAFAGREASTTASTAPHSSTA